MMPSALRRPTPRDVGPLTIGGLVVALTTLWLLARPAGVGLGNAIGQGLGAMSILMLSVALVLISTLGWVEKWFDGMDRAAIWHRRASIAGVGLLAPHIALASGQGSNLGSPLAVTGLLGLVALAVWAILPRWRSVVPAAGRMLIYAARRLPGIRQLRGRFGGYERWRAVHRTTGLFVAAGFAHGVLDATTFAGAPVLRWTYVAIGAVGLGFYVYRELFARLLEALHDYQVQGVAEVGHGITEISLVPLGRPVAFVPGQFAMLHLEAKDGWHRHPFTIASAPRDDVLRVTVKALGDYTTDVPKLVAPGMPAMVGAPHGRFDHRRGTDRQLWIAGGVGVAPFLSWLRAIDEPLAPRVDFFYSDAGPAPFAPEIRATAARTPSLHAHIVDTTVEKRLSAQDVLELSGGAPNELSVFLCGPGAMVTTLQRGLVHAGVPASRVYRESFDWR